nr:GPI inositol-deacylase PGAP1-like protein [Tanacetum cinerariifolium]
MLFIQPNHVVLLPPDMLSSRLEFVAAIAKASEYFEVVHCLYLDTLREGGWVGCIWKNSHRLPPKGLQGVVDQTNGLLTYVEENCKKYVYTPELRNVCIAGREVVS